MPGIQTFFQELQDMYGMFSQRFVLSEAAELNTRTSGGNEVHFEH